MTGVRDPPDEEGDVPVDDARFDPKLACITFECLERQAAAAAEHGDMDVAADYADAFFMLSSQMPDHYGVFLTESEAQAGESENGREYEHWIDRQMVDIWEWAAEHDHAVAEWFDRASEAMDHVETNQGGGQ